MVLILILTVILSTIAFLLLAPIKLVIDSRSNNYSVYMPGLFRFGVYLNNNSAQWYKARILFFNINPSPIKKTTSEKKNRVKKKGMGRKITVPQIKASIQALPYIVRVKRIDADIDTGDFPLNAQLLPLAQAVNGRNVSVRINFEDNNSVYIELVARMYRVLLSFFKIKRIK